jgi:branched-chain amino acid aminotransferase
MKHSLQTGTPGELPASLGPAWIDGRLVPPGEATVSAFDHGVTVGDGVFETCKVVGGQAFALTRHLGRLRTSAAGLDLEVPWSDGELAAAVGAVLAASPAASRLRITLTGGPGPLGSERAAVAPTLVVAASTGGGWAPTAAVATVPWRRNEHGALVGLKTTSYGENVRALARAKAAGADEAILANTAGLLCEGTGSNVFLAHEGRLVTPPLSSGCLAGITRALVCELVAVEEVDLPLDALAAAPEAFLTSSTRDVHPIATVDGVALAAAPGPLTRAAQAAWADLEARTLDP